MEYASPIDFQVIWNIISTLLFQVITFGICVYYLIQKQRIDGFLLAGGSFIHILTGIFYTIVLPKIIGSQGFEIYQHPMLMMVVNAFAFLGSILFTVGLIILIVNHISLIKKSNQ